MGNFAESSTRQHAVNLYHQGINVSEICRQLSRSRTWFYKWLHRYQSGCSNWHEDVSKAPHIVANKTPVELVDLVLNIRRDLEETKGSRIGAKNIQSRLIILGWDRLSLRTINRILKQHKATRKQQQHSRRKKNTNNSAEQTLKQASLF